MYVAHICLALFGEHFTELVLYERVGRSRVPVLLPRLAVSRFDVWRVGRHATHQQNTLPALGPLHLKANGGSVWLRACVCVFAEKMRNDDRSGMGTRSVP